LQSRRKRDAAIVRAIGTGRASVSRRRDRRLEPPRVRHISDDQRQVMAAGW
jgi:hypothetical protein